MTTKLRAFQIVINGVLFMLMSYQSISFIAELGRWRMDQWYWREMLPLMISFAVVASLVGSTRLNLQILRQANTRISLPTHASSQVLFLALSITILFFTLEMKSFIGITFDSHLSTHYMDITLPPWPWLIESSIFLGDPGFTVQDFGIIFFLLFPFAVMTIIALHNTGLDSDAETGYHHFAVTHALLKWHIALGAIILAYSLFFFFDLYRAGKSFLLGLQKDPTLLNSSNLASLAIGLSFFVLLLA